MKPTSTTALTLSLSVLLISFLPAIVSSPNPPAKYTTRQIYQFPNGTWIENLAVRSTGALLLTLVAPHALLCSISPLAPSPSPTLLHNFTASHGLTSPLGIAKTVPDTFFVVAENYSYATNTVAPGSIHIFRVSFPADANYTHPGGPPEISLLANLPAAAFLDGLAAHPRNASLLLAADPVLGQTWAINMATGAYTPGIADQLMAAPAGSALAFGINGVHVGDAGRTLYFSNSVRPALGKIGIAPDGGKTRVNETTVEIADDAPYLYDDFAVVPGCPADGKGYFEREARTVYAVTSDGNSIQKVDLKSGKTEIVAGEVNSTLMPEPSACQMGRMEEDRGWLYVTTAGGNRGASEWG